MDRAFELAISVRGRNGELVRWGADEAAVGNIPKGLSFGTSDPGGFKGCSLALSRPMQDSWPDLNLLRDARVYGGGNRTAWEGRLQEIPRHFGGDSSYSPGASGHSTALDDDPSFAEIYIDRDLSKWGDPSIQRWLDKKAAGERPQGQATVGGQDAGASGPGILHSFTRLATAVGAAGDIESWYYGGGVEIGELRFDAVNGGGVGAGDLNWLMMATGSVDDVLGSSTSTIDYNGTPSLNQVLTFAAGKKYLSFLTRYTGAVTADGNWAWLWRHPRLYGRHGLPHYGATAATEGLLGSDMVADIVRRTAPSLAFTTGEGGSIPPSGSIIPQMAFTEPVRGSDAIMSINAYEQRSWGVYDDKTFFWLPTDTYRKRWRVRRSLGHTIDLLGPQADSSVNGVVVSFTDAAGMRRYVGPPGTSGVTTSESLLDTSPTNPVNEAGIARKYGVLDLSFVTNIDGAIAVGWAWLREQTRNVNSRGSVVVKGLVEDENGVLHPSWAMRAGDSITPTDGDGIERRIIETNYEHDSFTNTCNCDSTPHKIEEMMEWMGLAVRNISD